MTQKNLYEGFSGTAPENYQRYFVPAIGGPVAESLIETASLRAGERVLDVACGTGVVTRLAAERVGSTGRVVGLDINPGMLAVARATPHDSSIEWYESPAETLPFTEASFDVVLSQMGLQFFEDKPAALREMRRVLAPGGRVVINVPGSIHRTFAIMGEALARHIQPELNGFVQAVFAMHDPDKLRYLMSGAGFEEVDVRAVKTPLRLPSPNEFLWQYLSCTPIAAAVAQSDDEQRSALERDVVSQWQEFVNAGKLKVEQGIVIATARR